MRALLEAPPEAPDGVTVHRSIAAIEPTLWDSLVDPDDLQSSHRFIGACEDSGVENAAYRHLLIRSKGAPVAVATLCRITVSLDLLAGPALRGLLSLPRRVHPRFLRVPVVFCGLPVSFGRPCLRIGSGADPAAVLDAVAREMESFADAERASVLCFKEFSDGEAAGMGALEAAGYVRAASLPACSLRLRWEHPSEYLGSLRAPYRRQILQARRTARERGHRIRLVEDFGEECDRIFALYEQVIDRARYRLERLNPSFFEKLNDGLGCRSRALLLECEGRLLASAVLLYGPRTVTFLLAGIDYELHREHAAYPNLVAAVVEEAIRVGAERLELGQTSYALKTRLGGVPDPRWIYVRSRNPLLHRMIRAASPALFPATRVASRRVFRSDR